MKTTNDRFIEAYKQQDAQNRTYVLVDRETGVNYLLAGFMASSGVSWPSRPTFRLVLVRNREWS